jgi:DNA-binding beta-propeller fold protein YncE
MKKIVALLCALLMGAAAGYGQTAGGYHLLKKIQVEGDGTWDYLAIDQNARRLYVSHQTQVEVIDLDSEKPVGKISGMNGVHGIAVAPKLGCGFITSGNNSTVKMFDLKTLQSISDLPAGNGADGILFEPVTKRVFAFNHRAGSLTVIDAVAGKALENIELGGQPEFPVTDGKGTVWVNLEDKSTLLKIDAKEMKILQRWPVAPCEAPASMAMDQKNRRLFVGCNSKVMAVADADSGKIVTTLPIGEHVDATAFDPETKLIFNANRASVTIIHQDAPDKYSVVQTLETLPRANTLALDLKTRKIYLATAQFREKPASTPDGKPQQERAPGSFMVLVYGK